MLSMIELSEEYTECILVSYPTVLEKQAKFLAGFGVVTLFVVVGALHGIEFLRDNLVRFLLTFLVVGGMTILGHESIHGIVYTLLGYEIDWGKADRLNAFYAGAFDQVISRKESMLALSAPLLLLNLIFLPLFFAPIPLLVFSAFAVLVVNTSMSRADLYAIFRVYNAPSGSIVYHTNPEEFRICIPDSKDSN